MFVASKLPMLASIFTYDTYLVKCMYTARMIRVSKLFDHDDLSWKIEAGKITRFKQTFNLVNSASVHSKQSYILCEIAYPSYSCSQGNFINLNSFLTISNSILELLLVQCLI